MTSPYQQFSTDPALETDGIILDYGGYAIRIARSGGANRKFTKAIQVRQKPYARQIQNDTLDEEVARKLLIQAFADAIVLDWGHRRPAEGAAEVDADAPIAWGSFPGPDGQPLPYGRDNVIRVLTDLPDLFADIRQQAGQAALFRRQQVEDAAGNSATG